MSDVEMYIQAGYLAAFGSVFVAGILDVQGRLTRAVYLAAAVVLAFIHAGVGDFASAGLVLGIGLVAVPVVSYLVVRIVAKVVWWRVSRSYAVGGPMLVMVGFKDFILGRKATSV